MHTLPDESDVLIVGGGIHGAGIAQAVAAAGHRVVIVEKSEWAAGTSRRSSKLIHGGLRYLESRQWRLVRESLHERELLLRLAPDLVQRRQFFLPVYPATTRRPWLLHVGLGLYSWLAGSTNETSYRLCPRSEWSQLDGLTTHQLQHVFQFWDAQTDDRRLTEAVMRSAESLGALGFPQAIWQRGEIRDSECVSTIRFADREWTHRSQVLINAAGPWARAVLSQIRPTQSLPTIELIQGTHLELPGRMTQGCYYVEAPEDRRAVFVMPWHDHTLIGTTERKYFGESADQVAPTDEETDYLLRVYRHYFPDRSDTLLDRWAGLRVLPAGSGSAFGRSRETQLLTNTNVKPRLLSVFGGKLTAYRATSARVLQQVAQTLPIRTAIADTRSLKLT